MPSAAARTIAALRQAGFDTPAATSDDAAKPIAGSPTPLANAACPLTSLSSVGAAAAALSLPSLFASASRCPCGKYDAADTPQTCAWAANGHKQNQKDPTAAKQAAGAGTTRQQQKGNPSLAAVRAGLSLRPQQPQQPKIPIRAFSSTSGTQSASAASAGSSSSALDPSVDPLQPPAISLPPSLSAAHSGLLAIEEYRAAIQALGRPCATPAASGGVSDGSGGSHSGGSSPPSLSSFAAARQSLQRTLDIVAYIPGQPWFSLHVKSLLAWLARKSGSAVEEHRLRGEVVRELDKMAAAARRAAKAGAWPGAGDAPSLKPADTLALHQAINALALAALRTRSYAEVLSLSDTWLKRMEPQLFGGAATSAAATTFSTGATHSRTFAEYLTMMQVALISHAFATHAAATAAMPASSAATTAPSAAVVPADKLAASRAALQSRIASLAARMPRHPPLAASLEWKLFRGELLLMPSMVHQCFPELAQLCPTEEETKPKHNAVASAGEPASVSSGLDAASSSSSSSLFDRAIVYFLSHPELHRLPLSDSNLRRAWYSPLVHAYLLASEEELNSVLDSATPPTADAGASSVPADASPAAADAPAPTAPAPPRSLFHLGASLRFIEGSLSSSPFDSYLLRTLAALAAANYRAPTSTQGFGDAIQAEGLFRAVVGRCESMLTSAHAASAAAASAGGVVSPSLNAPLFSFYLPVVLDYLHLLSRLSWNGRSRQPESRALFLSKLVVPLQRDPRARDSVELMWDTLPRQLSSGSAKEWMQRIMQIRSVDEVTEEMLELPLRALPSLAPPAPAAASAPASASLTPSRVPPMPQHPLPEWLVEKLQVGSGVCS